MKKNGIAVSRRGFLALSGAGAAGLAASGCTSGKIADFLELAESDNRPPVGPEKWLTSVCGECDGGCSIRVRTIGGRPVAITGNPLYPLNGKGLCPKGVAGLQVLFSPDRIRNPLRRTGNRGEGQWEEIGWDEAIHSVAEKLNEIRARHEPHELVFLSGEGAGLLGSLISRFCRTFGSPNDIRENSAGIAAQRLAVTCTQGRDLPCAYDLEQTSYLLSFGSPLLEGGSAPVQTLRQYGYLRQERPGPKAKIVQVEPRLSVTAAKADEWIPIHPGTEAALALGIAYVLIRENLYDRSFVEDHTFGFEDWRDEKGIPHRGFKSIVVNEYHLDEVARLTGVPVATILRIAKELGTQKPAVAMGEIGATNAVFASMAIHALNALVGSIDVPGGVVFPHDVPFAALAEVDLDETAKQGLAKPRLDRAGDRDFPLAHHVAGALPRAIVEDRPYKVSALFLHRANPLFSSPQPERVADAFRKIPFIVSFSPFLDESSAFADLILPDHTPLERWQDQPAPPAARYSLFGLRQPVVSPLYNTLHAGDAVIRIARAMGGPMAGAFPWTDFLEALKQGAAGIFESRRGGIVEGLATRETWTGAVEKRGWWYPTYRTFDEFWAQLAEKGGWWNPAYSFGEWDRIFPNPTGKFQFYSLTLKNRLERLASTDQQTEALLAELKIDARGDLVFLPHLEAPRLAGDEHKYPLRLNVVRLMPLSEEGSANLPFLQEIAGPHLHMQWCSWLEIHPDTAERLGITDGDMVWVESPAGKIRVRARCTLCAIPGVVNIPANLGHTAYGRWAKGIGVNPMQVAAVEFDRLGGLLASGATRVMVYRA